MKSKLKITSVELVKGLIYDNWMERYSASGNKRVANPKALKIIGYVDGIGEVCFFTPTVVLVTEYGANTEFYNVYQKNNWFLEASETNISNKTKELPSYVQFKKNLEPSVKTGDVVNISFSVKGVFGSKTVLNRVKLIN